MKSDKIFGGITMLLGVIQVVEGIRLYPSRNNVGVGDHTFLLIIGAIMIVLGALLIILKLKNLKVEFPEKNILLSILGIYATLFVYWFLMKHLGFLISSAICLLALFKIIGKYKFVRCIIYSAISTVSLYVLFDILLGMPFPKGPFGF